MISLINWYTTPKGSISMDLNRNPIKISKLWKNNTTKLLKLEKKE